MENNWGKSPDHVGAEANNRRGDNFVVRSDDLAVHLESFKLAFRMLSVHLNFVLYGTDGSPLSAPVIKNHQHEC